MVTKKKVAKKKEKLVAKKITKKQAEDMRLDLAKGELEDKKRVYGEYVKVLVKYNIKTMAYSAIMYDELFHAALMRKMEKARENDESISDLIFGKRTMSELECLKDKTEYYDKLTSMARSNIEQMTDKTKTKIVKDALESQHGWLNILE